MIGLINGKKREENEKKRRNKRKVTKEKETKEKKKGNIKKESEKKGIKIGYTQRAKEIVLKTIKKIYSTKELYFNL